jgi:hypothetical protein
MSSSFDWVSLVQAILAFVAELLSGLAGIFGW